MAALCGLKGDAPCGWQSPNREASNRLEIAVFGESGDILETQKNKHLTQKI